MKRTNRSGAFTLLLAALTTAYASSNIDPSNVHLGIQEREIKDLEYSALDMVSLTRRETITNAVVDNLAGQQQASENPITPVTQLIGNNGLDANALLNGLAQGQAQGQPGSAVGASADSLVSDILRGVGAQPNTPSIDQILQGLEKQGQGNGAESIRSKETTVQQPSGPEVVQETIRDSTKNTATTSAQEAQITTATNTTTTLVETSLMLSLLGSTQAASTEILSAANQTTNAAITVIASSQASAAPQPNSANATGSVVTTINTSGLTQDGLVAATTTSAVGKAITVQVSTALNATGTTAREANSTVTSSLILGGVTVIAGSGGSNATVVANSTAAASIHTSLLTQDGLVAATTTSAVGAAVTVQASGGNVTSIAAGLPTSSTSIAAAGSAANASAITVVASNSTTSGVAAVAPGLPTSSTSARAGSTTIAPSGVSGTTTVSASTGAVTVVAGSGNSTGAADAANKCSCACSCPAGSFPMAAPQAAPFQLMPAMGSMSSPSTLATQAVTIIAGGSAPANPSQAEVSTSVAPINSATLTTAGLVGTTTISAAGPGVTLQASSQLNSVPAQSQVAGSSSSSAAELQNNRLPFDISTIALQSKVTVNLGARAMSTGKRTWLY